MSLKGSSHGSCYSSSKVEDKYVSKCKLNHTLANEEKNLELSPHVKLCKSSNTPTFLHNPIPQLNHKLEKGKKNEIPNKVWHWPPKVMVGAWGKPKRCVPIHNTHANTPSANGQKQTKGSSWEVAERRGIKYKDGLWIHTRSSNPNMNPILINKL